MVLNDYIIKPGKLIDLKKTYIENKYPDESSIELDQVFNVALKKSFIDRHIISVREDIDESVSEYLVDELTKAVISQLHSEELIKTTIREIIKKDGLIDDKYRSKIAKWIDERNDLSLMENDPFKLIDEIAKKMKANHFSQLAKYKSSLCMSKWNG